MSTLSTSHSTSAPIVVINGYLFCSLDELEKRQIVFKKNCEKWSLKGTILLSHEGINVALSGERHNIDAWVAWLRQDPLLQAIWLKETYAKTFPFSKVVVKIKSEIISMLAPEIDPTVSTAPNIKPETLKQWLDEGRDITILDARNDYEVAFGAFEGAIHPSIPGFKQFKAGLEAMEIDKNQPVVTYCTGGVRCEKSSAWMQQMGFKEVYQLEGGILNYFETVGGAHYEGECFVFDDRIALRTDLTESDRTQCEGCFMPVDADKVHVLGPRQFHYCQGCAEAIAFDHASPVSSASKAEVDHAA